MIATNTTRQTTLANKISCSGIGLHSGSQVNMVIYPAIANTGILFRRMDVPVKHATVPARFDAVCDTRLGTTLRNSHGVTVATVEHLMAAFWGAGIDNAVVELDGPEVPIMDGSSEPFMALLEEAGITELAAPRLILKVLKKVEIQEGDSVACVEPNFEGDEGCTLSVDVSYDNAVVGQQSSHYDFREVSFKQSVSRARTFGFEHEVEALQKAGLALGGSLDNAIVVGKDRVLNESGLRFDDEFVRHKALDCLGDLFLAGVRMDARLSFFKPGHGINNHLLHAIFADETAYELVPAGKSEVPAFDIAQAILPAYA